MDLESIANISYDDRKYDEAIFADYLTLGDDLPTVTFHRANLLVDIVRGSEGLDQKYANRGEALNLLSVYNEKLVSLLEDGWKRRSFTAIRKLGTVLEL